jgi:hypothetical protein
MRLVHIDSCLIILDIRFDLCRFRCIAYISVVYAVPLGTYLDD